MSETNGTPVSFERAGDEARDAHANARALGLYDQALACLGADEAVRGDRLRLMLKKGRLLELAGAWDAGAMLAADAAALAEAEGDRHRLAAARDLCGTCLQHLGQYAEAAEEFSHALALYRHLGDPRGQMEVLSRLGKTAFLQARYDQARVHYVEQLEIAIALGDPSGIARVQGNFGNLHLVEDDLGEALACYRRQLDLAESVPDEREMAIALGNMGIVYRRLLDFPAALHCYERKLVLTEKIGDKEGLAISHGNIGVLRWYQGDYAGASECCQRQLAIVDELGDRRSLAAIYGNLGDLHKQLGDFAEAEGCYSRSLTLCEELQLRYYQAYYSCHKADLCLKLGLLGEALALVGEARAISEAIGDDETRFDSRVLAARIQGEATRSSAEKAVAIDDLRVLAAEAHAETKPERDERLAVVHAALFRLTADPSDAHIGEASYRALYARTGNHAHLALAEALAANAAGESEEVGRPYRAAVAFNLVTCVGEACGRAAAGAGVANPRLSYAVNHDVPAWIIGDPEQLNGDLDDLLRYGIERSGEGGVRLAIGVLESRGTEGLVLEFNLEFGSRRVIDSTSDRSIGFRRLVQPVLSPAPPTLFVPQLSDEPMPLVPQSIDATLGRRLPLRILVAEDDEVSRKVLLRALEKMGYRADIAMTGEAAITRVKQSPYDLVFMDIHMPIMDGLEATRRITAELADDARPYIIATTASVMQNARRQCIEAGMNDYLAKPLRVRQLQDAIVRAAEERAGAGDAPRE